MFNLNFSPDTKGFTQHQIQTLDSLVSPLPRNPLITKKKTKKTNCLNGKFPLTHQLETSQFYFCKPSLSAVVFLCFLTLSATLGIQWFSLLSVAPRCEAKAQADVKFPTFHIQDTVL